jgi:chromosome segregation ATPase
MESAIMSPSSAMELRQLASELSAVARERDEARASIDVVLQDMMDAHMEMDRLKQAASGQDAEIARLSQLVRERDQQLAQIHAGYQQNSTGNQNLQRRYDEVVNKLSQLEPRPQKQQQQQQQHGDDGELRARAAQLESTIQQMSSHQAQLQQRADESDRQRAAAEDRAQQLLQEATQVQAAAEGQQQTADDVARLQRLLEFHKSNGEQASRRAREVLAVNRGLEAALDDLRKQVRDQQMALGSGHRGKQPHMPGSFQ